MHQQIPCHHCGDPCEGDHIIDGEQHFCCVGCQSVYEILHGNGLEAYYRIQQNPGIKLKASKKAEQFAYLDESQTFSKLIDFKSDTQVNITLFLPQIHCSACIWLLEHLPKLHPGILKTQVDFLAKKCFLSYNPNQIKLSEVAALLTSIGYEPDFRLKDTAQANHAKIDWGFYTRLGIAGFCFGNIMLLSFPEYLSGSESVDENFRHFFSYLNLLLALPVLLYSSRDFFRSAFQGLKQGVFSIDIPIVLGILVLFSWSTWEILSAVGAGYMDSLAGLVFFLLAGRWFQRKTYDRLSFDNDYSAYFPLSSTKLENGKEKSVAISALEKGDRILVRHGEIIPGDAILLSPEARIDYSFVTGETEAISTSQGEVIYAGGKQEGSIIQLELIKAVSQSYLSQLWQHQTFKQEQPSVNNSISNHLSKYFTLIILAIAVSAGAYWFPINPAKAIQVFAAVLIVACPCGLALSVPITLGSTLRILSRWGMFVKNTDVIEAIGKIGHIVFDKTGTLTSKQTYESSIVSRELSLEEQQLVLSLANQSTHPVSRSIKGLFPSSHSLSVNDYQEVPGKGISGNIMGHQVKIGSFDYVANGQAATKTFQSGTYISINGKDKISVRTKEVFREGLQKTLAELAQHYELSLLSGDQPSKKSFIAPYLPPNMELLFAQKPQDKLNYIANLQQKGKKVMMVGDGLNDAGAFKQSDIGIAITESQDAFSPACDVILKGKNLNKIAQFLHFAKRSLRLVRVAFIISLCYNLIGLFLAVQGLLSPLWVAILMPLSSISIVAFGLIGTNILVKNTIKKPSAESKRFL